MGMASAAPAAATVMIKFSGDMFWWDKHVSWYVLPTMTINTGWDGGYPNICFMWLKIYGHIYFKRS